MGLLQDLFGDDDAAIAEGVYRKLEAIHDDVRRLTYIVSEGDRKIMADIDVLNAAAAQLGADETAEEALGAKILTGIQALQAQNAPDLKPAIAALQAVHTQITNDLAQGGTLLASLTPPAAATSTTSGAATVEPTTDAAKPA